MRCDGGRPCQRCTRNDSECKYSDTVKDVNVLRIEKLEEEVEDLRAALHVVQTSRQGTHNASVPATSPNLTVRTTSDYVMHQSSQDDRSAVVSNNRTISGQPNAKDNAVESGLVSWEQAVFWYRR